MQSDVYAFCKSLFEKGVERYNPKANGLDKFVNKGGGRFYYVHQPFSPDSAIGFNLPSLAICLESLPIALFVTSKIRLDPSGRARVKPNKAVFDRTCNAIALYCRTANTDTIITDITHAVPELKGLVDGGAAYREIIPAEVEKEFTVPHFGSRVPVKREQFVFIAAPSGAPGDKRYIWYNKPKSRR